MTDRINMIKVTPSLNDFWNKKNKKQTDFENETHNIKVRQTALTVSHVAVCAKLFLVGQMNRRIWTYLDVLQT